MTTSSSKSFAFLHTVKFNFFNHPVSIHNLVYSTTVISVHIKEN